MKSDTHPNPKYTHDCTACILLGTITIGSKTTDAYFCPGKPNDDKMLNSILSRFGNSPEQYSCSLPMFWAFSPHMAAAQALYFEYLDVTGHGGIRHDWLTTSTGQTLHFNRDVAHKDRERTI